MYYLKKQIEISASHKLELDYDSPCKQLHGHNWILTLYLKSLKLNKNGMLTDFSAISEIIKNKIDHKNLNEVFDFNPTAENIAKWVVENIGKCYKCDVQETEGNIASYEI